LVAKHDRRDKPLTMSGKMESVVRKLQESPPLPFTTQPVSLCIQAEVGGYDVAGCHGTFRLVDTCTGWYAESEEESEEGSEELPTMAAIEPKQLKVGVPHG